MNASYVNYTEVLVEMHDMLQPSTYIEVGVSNGTSLCKSGAAKAIGIDPDPSQILETFDSNVIIYPNTSDQFFSLSMEDQRGLLRSQNVDFAFIDGMHLFEFALRDFIGLEKLSHPGTVITIHDCLPFDEATSRRERLQGWWTGDIWRLMLALNEYRPDLEIVTLDVDPSGLGVVRGFNGPNDVLESCYDQIVEKYMTIPFEYLTDKYTQLKVIPTTYQTIQQAITGKVL